MIDIPHLGEQHTCQKEAVFIMNFIDRAKGFASLAKEKADVVRGDITEKAGPLADKLAEKAAPLADKAADMAAKGVSVAASQVDKATGGKYRERIDNVSEKLSNVLNRDGHPDTPESQPGSQSE
jgi:hypothetical protein